MTSIRTVDSIEALRALARRRLPRPVFDFFDGAADEEVTLRRNRQDLATTALAPRILRDVSVRDLRTAVLGSEVDLPLIIGPTGLAALGWPRADAALARAAAAFNIPFVISTSSSVRLEDIAEAAPGARLWFQVYVYRDRELVRSLIARARACGVEALVLTVDTPVLGWRRRDHRNGFTVPLKPGVGLAIELARHPGWSLQIARHGVPRMQNFVEAGKGSSVASLAHLMTRNMDASVTWDDLRWLRDQWDGPLVIKGILSAEDAEKAVAAGVQGVLVSNHGGRQLDGAPSTISVLGEVAAAVGGRAEVYMDGGVRQGADMAKVRALGGAAAVVGRATLYGVAAGGEAGARQALSILRTEYDRCLALLGCAATRDLDASYVRRRIHPEPDYTDPTLSSRDVLALWR